MLVLSAVFSKKRNRALYRMAKSCRAVLSGNIGTSIIEQLESRRLLTTDMWTNAVGGDWDTAANWSLGVPTASEDAAITLAGSYTVTHSTSATDSSRSLVSSVPFTLSGGSLTVSTTVQVNNTFILSGGTLGSANVLAGTGGEGVTITSGTLSGVTLSANCNVSSGSTLDVTNGLNLNSSNLTLSSTGSSTFVYFQGTQILGGTGHVIFGGSSSNNIIYSQGGGTAATGATLTTAAGINIGGTLGGQIAGYSTFDSFINKGTINANASGQTISVGANMTWSSTGLMAANLGGTLSLTGNWTNNGVIAQGTASTVIFGGSFTSLGTFNNSGGIVDITGTYDNTGRTLSLTATTGSWELVGGTINNGTITATGGAELLLSGSGGTLSGVNISSGTVVDGTQGGSVQIYNGLTLNGTLELGGINNGASATFVGTQTLAGTGNVVFGTYGNNGYISAQGDGNLNPATLTIASGITISGGYGLIYGQNGANAHNNGDTIINNGTINANFSGGTITVEGGGGIGSLVNNGLLEATSGATMSVNYLSGNINSMIVTGNGSVLKLNGTGYINNLGLAAPAGTTLTLSGTFNNPSGQLISATGATLSLGDQSSTSTNTWINTGTISATNSTVNLGGSITLATLGNFSRTGGTVNLTGTLNDSSTTLALTSVTGSWVLHGGTINNGTITATGGAELLLSGSGGTLSGVNISSGTVVDGTQGGSVQIYNGLTLNGTLELGGINNGASATFVGTQTLAGTGNVVFGTYGNNGYISAQGDGNLNPATLTIASGITISGGYGLIYGQNGANAHNNGDTIINNGTINANFSGGTITVEGGGGIGSLVNNGLLEATSGATMSVNYLSGNINSMIVTGNGSVLKLNGTGYINNLGLAAPAGTTLTLSGTFNNPSGQLISATGATLSLGDQSSTSTNTWINTGTISATNSTVNLGGSITLATLGNFSRTGGTVNLTGTLNDSSTTLALTSVTGSWVLHGGTINNGTITATGGAELLLSGSGGTLSGVNISSGTVVDGTQGGSVQIYNGLTLNGTLELGGINNGASATFVGTQTLAGTGNVVFGTYGNNGYISAQGDGNLNPATLTIASGITISGGYGLIYGQNGANAHNNGDTIINNGTINANFSGGTITVEGGGGIGSLVNNSVLEATNGGSLTVNNLSPINGVSTLAGGGTGTLSLSGDLLGNTTNSTGFSPLENVAFTATGTVSSPQLFEAMSADSGAGTTGYSNNFVYGGIVVGSNNYLQLVDQSRNSASTSPEAVYAVSVTVPAGSTLDLHGLHLYAGSSDVQGTILNGIITLTALPPAVAAVSGNGQAIADQSTTTTALNGTGFGSIAQNTPNVDQFFTISNNGIATLTLGNVVVPTGFTLLSAPATSIPAHSSSIFEVGLNTANVGTLGGDVSFATNDSANNPYNFEINATVTAAAPVATVSYIGQPVRDGSAVPTVASGTDLGTIAQGGAPVAHTFTISNFGNAILNLGAISLPAGYSLLGTPNATLAAGGSTSFTLGLPTTVPGTFSGIVSFSTNDPYNSVYTFTVTGTITAAPAPITSVSYNGQAIADHSAGTSTTTGTNFGFSLQSGAPVVHTFTIINTGNALLTLGTISLPAGFNLVGTPATSVAAGGSVSFTFGLQTTNVGTFSGNVDFTTNDANNNPFTFAVTGVVGLTSSAYIAITPPNLQGAIAGQNTSFTLGTFTQSNATGPFKVTVNWGDGSSNSVFTLSAAGTIPAQSHTYTGSGNDTVTLSVIDSLGTGSNLATFTVNVVAAPATITLTPPVSQNASPGQANYILLGSFAQTGAIAPYNVSVNWGDGSAESLFSVGNAGALPATSHTYANSGSDTVTLTVTDSVGHTSNSGTFTITVASAVITLTAPAGQSATAGQNAVFSLGSFTALNATGPFTITTNWGDGSSESIFSIAGAGTITPTAHTYAFAGSDTVTLTVMDSNNHTSNSATFGVVVGSQTAGIPWLSTNSQATFNSSNSTLTVNGTASIVGDPGKYNTSLTVICASSVSHLIIDTLPADGGDGSSTVHLASLTLTNSGYASITSLGSSQNQPNQGVLVINNLTIGGGTDSWQGQLDLGKNGLDVVGGNLAILTNQVKEGYQGGLWDGEGIASTSAAADGRHLTAAGILLNNDGAGHALFSSNSSTGLFNGYNPSLNDVLLKYTYYGDTTLDGKVDGSDYSRIDTAFLNHTTGWNNGDLNYDGVINGSDYTLIDNAFNTQGARLSATVATQIGESIAEAATRVTQVSTSAILKELMKRTENTAKIPPRFASIFNIQKPINSISSESWADSVLDNRKKVTAYGFIAEIYEAVQE